jgi:omega-amidase
MQRYLKITILQSDIIWQDNNQNLHQFSEKIKKIESETDIIILPEMFTTGFSMEPQKNAEKMNGKTIQWMQNISKQKNCAIAGSVIIQEEDKYYNRFLFVHPSGKINQYNKRHLFTLAGEDKIYTSGSEKVIIDFKGWKICPLICYDLRFPVWARNIENYDILLYVANWPKPRISAWDALLKARSIENMCYTIGVNRVGEDANKLEYNGHSAIYNCLGEQIGMTEENKEITLSVTLDKDHISETRNRLPFLNDKDSFKII